METKRRLPSWMAGASKVSKPLLSLDVEASDVISKEEVSVVTKSTKPKATRKHKKEACLPSDGKSFLVKCETKRKKGGTVEKDDSEQEVVVEKRKRGRVGRKVEEPKPSRKKEERGYGVESNNENQAPSSDEEDEDLTMDDILRIAKEFVANDKSDVDEEKASKGECKLESKFPYTSSSVTTASLIAPQDTNTRSPMHEENTSSIVTLGDSGDPAQDMLDLFLGPLLKKPIRKEETSSKRDIILPHEVKDQQHDAVKAVTLTKKKSSLRDAVAMLLD